MLKEELLAKLMEYPESFTYGNINEIVNSYELPEGSFILGKNGEEYELVWGANDLDTLRHGIEKIRDNSPGNSFIFRYANHLNKVLAARKVISQWGYQEKPMYVGYIYNLSGFTHVGNSDSIELLKPEDAQQLLLLQKEIFDMFNFTEEELNEWLNNDDYLILVYKKACSVKGFIILYIHGSSTRSCFVRELGVCSSERGQGLGRKLLLTGLGMAKKKGAVKSMLWVDMENSVARDLYEKIGYQLDENEAEVVFEVS